jgi:four helix bundle protein
MSGRFEDLEVWQYAMELVYDVYDVTANFPRDERYGLTSQMRRAAVSIPSNIAEGKGRTSDKDFGLFLCHARGSVYELQTQIMLARHLGYFSDESASDVKTKADRVGRMLNGLITYTQEEARARH